MNTRSQPTINLGTRMEDLTRMVCKSCEMDAIFLARDRFRRFSLFDIEHLDGLIFPRSYETVALVVKIQRRDMVGAILLRRSKQLEIQRTQLDQGLCRTDETLFCTNPGRTIGANDI